MKFPGLKIRKNRGSQLKPNRENAPTPTPIPAAPTAPTLTLNYFYSYSYSTPRELRPRSCYYERNFPDLIVEIGPPESPGEGGGRGGGGGGGCIVMNLALLSTSKSSSCSLNFEGGYGMDLFAHPHLSQTLDLPLVSRE